MTESFSAGCLQMDAVWIFFGQSLISFTLEQSSINPLTLCHKQYVIRVLFLIRC